MRKFILGTLSVLFIFALMQWNAARIDNELIFPYPIQVLRTFRGLLEHHETYRIIFFSFRRLLTSLVFASSLGIFLGLISGVKPFLSEFLNPIVTSLRTLPVASIIVIILIIYGQGLSLYIITFLLLFPIMFEATKQGVINIDNTLIEALILEKRRSIYELVFVYLPLTKGYIKTGFLQSIGIGFKVLVMAEYISQQKESIGYQLYLGRINMNYDKVFAWTIIIIILVTIIEILVNKLKKI